MYFVIARAARLPFRR